MPGSEAGLSEIDCWALEAKWTVANSEAEAVRTVHTAAAESALWVRTMSAEIKAETQLRTLQQEYEKRMGNAKPEEQDGIGTWFNEQRKIIANDLGRQKSMLQDDEKLALAKVEPEARARLYARLVDPKGGTVCDTSASQPPTVYYVIVGRGTAAVLDHATLRQTDAGDTRLTGSKGTKLPVLHIGLPDPWFYYHAHGLGQPPYLLTLPGFHFRPTPLDRTIRTGMHSNDFAYKTLQEWSLLKVKYAFPHLEGWVAIIQKQGSDKKTPDPATWTQPEHWNEFPDLAGEISKIWAKKFEADAPYRLIVVLPDQTLRFIYAEKIDICSGLPRFAVQAGTPHHTATTQVLKKAAPLLWTPPHQWPDDIRQRQILTGPEALMEMTVWDPSQRAYVNGAGGIGLNMIERAEDVGCSVDWLHYQTLHPASFNLARNDTVLKDPDTGGPRAPGTSGMRDDRGAVRSQEKLKELKLLNAIPCKARWRFGRFAEVNAYTALTVLVGKIKVVVTDKDGKGRIHDYWDSYDSETCEGQKVVNGAFPFSVNFKKNNPDLLPSDGDGGLYDRVFCTAGAYPQSLGSAYSITGGKRTEALDKGTLTVGLQLDGGAIRILGAAAGFHPEWVGKRNEATRIYFDDLPLSAVPPGFIFQGFNIAHANGYFDSQPNSNVNTMTQEEIETFLKTKSVANSLAAALAAAIAGTGAGKRRPANGFGSTADIERALQSVSTVTSDPNWKAAVAKLETDYREAGKLRD